MATNYTSTGASAMTAGRIVSVTSVIYQGLDTHNAGSWVIVGAGESDQLQVTTPTPQSSSSKFLIQCTIGICSGSPTTAFRIYRGGSVVAGLNGTGASARIGVSFRIAGSQSHTDPNHSSGGSFSAVDSPGSASASVYSIRYFNQSVSTSYIGSSTGDGDTAASYGSRTSSSLTVMEIAG
jgi:hypothetical protein